MSDRSRSTATGRLFAKGRPLSSLGVFPEPLETPRLRVEHHDGQSREPIRTQEAWLPPGKLRQDPPGRQPEASPSPAPGDHGGSSFNGAGHAEALAHTYWGLKLQAFFLKVRVYLMGKNHREIETPADFSRARPRSWETPRPAGISPLLRTRPFPLFTKPACHNDTRHRSTPRACHRSTPRACHTTGAGHAIGAGHARTTSRHRRPALRPGQQSTNSRAEQP